MNGHIPEEDWAMYSAEAPDELSIRIRTHIRTCQECAEVEAQLAAWPVRLKEEGRRLRSALQVSDQEVERMLGVALEKIGVAPRRQTTGFAEKISILRALLEPLAGVGITRAAVENAMRGSGNNWGGFVTQFSATIRSACGVAAGQLADRAGMAIGI